MAGCGLALAFSGRFVISLLDQYKLIPAILIAETQSLEYSCKDADCVGCIDGVKNTPNAIIFTGGSTFGYGVDVATFSAAMPRPVVNCIRNDSRVDAYRSFFAYARVSQPGQVVFHGYNSWAVNSPGTWAGNREASFFRSADVPRLPTPASERIRRQEQVDLSLLLANVFLMRTATESPSQWREMLRARSGFFRRHDLSFWPLSRESHLQRRLQLMKRWFGLSGYARSFIIDADRLQPAEDIAARHEQFFAALAPTERFVFFPGPELTEALPAHVLDVMRQSKAVMLQTLARYPGARHVEVDYRACGVTVADFWHDAAMYFDIPHVSPFVRPRVTACIGDALKKAGL